MNQAVQTSTDGPSGQLELMPNGQGDIPLVPQRVYIPVDHRVPIFSGAPVSKNDPSWSEWVSNLKAALRAWGTPEDQQAEFALRYLGGVAKREVLVLTPQSRASLTEVLRHLEEIYGDNASLQTLMTQFYARQQRQGESARQYALCLQELLQRVEVRFPHALPDKNCTLRDRFVESLLLAWKPTRKSRVEKEKL
ncbi:Zinc finger CCHC domain-containing protein 12 [Holothuria leucospilota]|uniref:Zinc finger CCHC domain-containing protein 12 n=1 Tax=Holothuria leucospilota TaxID=206669 RepID=A0A9Q0YGG9_HOLLE|nr:Zinc finger CCHC domain-containing protein 12 [Holothuria leucospilota]